MLKIFMVLFILLFSVTSFAERFEGYVVKVADGNTITVLDQGVKKKIRLAEIDAPEKNQPFGYEAKFYLARLVLGKIVHVEANKKGRYGRYIGKVGVGTINTEYDGMIILNDELVRVGLAWHYKVYSKNKEMAIAEKMAKDSKIGLWSQKKPIPPWKWCKGVRK